jgi:p21-activated kinase 1
MGTTMPRPRTSTITPKKNKGILGFITNFLNSNKRPEITTPHDLVHLTHIGFNSSTGELTGLPKEWLQLLQDSGIFNSKSDQEKYPPSVVDKMGHTPIPGGPQSPPVPGTAQSAHTRASKSVDDNVVPAASPFLHPSSGTLTDNSKRPPLSPSKKAHSPAPHHPAPSPSQPVQLHLGRSTLQRTAPKLPRNDALVRANTKRDRRPAPPVPPIAVKALTRISRTASTADLLSKSQPTAAVNTPAAEHRAPRHPTAPQQQSAAAVVLGKTAGATPRRREKKEDKANDADIVKRLQQICTDADPTQLYHNLVKIGQG